MHFILQAGERGSIAVRVELVVQLKHHAQRVLRTRERLKMPCAFSEKAAALDDLQAQIRDITQFGDVRREHQDVEGIELRSRYSQSAPDFGNKLPSRNGSIINIQVFRI